MGLDFDQLFPAKYLKAGEFQGKDVTLTVASVILEELPDNDGKPKQKGVITFKETPKALVLNKTNGLSIRGMFGRDTGAWVGKRITFFPAPIDFGDAEIAIRVRGSPDIAKDMDVEIKLARKKARTVRMKKTGVKANGKAAPLAEEPPPLNEPPPDMVLPGQAEFGVEQ